GGVKRTHVLIVSSWRSGSSFLGQILNHHPDVFYVYEPARMVWLKFPKEKAGLLHYPIRDLLRSLFACDISPLYEYLPSSKYISNLPFWSESWALCSPPACNALDLPTEYDQPICYRTCGHAPLTSMAESCEAHSHVVLKTVRVLDLRYLLPLFQDPSLDLRVIHLVRDPRAVALSRMKFQGYLNDEDLIVFREEQEKKKKKETQPNVTQVMGKICKAQMSINEFARQADKALQRKYLMIRHEDLSKEPLAVGKKIYEFAGLSFNEDVQKWLHNATHEKEPAKKGFMTFIGDSMQIVQKWRKELAYNVVVEIQDACAEAMELFGYRKVRNPKEQKNLALNLVTDVEKDS
ncbi:hypothetical protein GDO81_021114, partial [Engystomops pustulosus]